MDRIEELAMSFPSLQQKPGVLPWDAVALDGWASSGAPSHGALVSARFVLAVWDPNAEWDCGRFELMEALAAWDTWHRVAFIAWAASPWWP